MLSSKTERSVRSFFYFYSDQDYKKGDQGQRQYDIDLIHLLFVHSNEIFNNFTVIR